MGIITTQIEISGKILKSSFEALIDTGAEGNYIKYDIELIEKLGFSETRETYYNIPGVNGKVMALSFIFKSLKIINTEFLFPEFITIKNIDYDAIIGVEIMQILGIKFSIQCLI